MSDIDAEDEETVKEAYETYCFHASKEVSDLPTWDELSDVIKNAWVEAVFGAIWSVNMSNNDE